MYPIVSHPIVECALCVARRKVQKMRTKPAHRIAKKCEEFDFWEFDAKIRVGLHMVPGKSAKISVEPTDAAQVLAPKLDALKSVFG